MYWQREKKKLFALSFNLFLFLSSFFFINNTYTHTNLPLLAFASGLCTYSGCYLIGQIGWASCNNDSSTQTHTHTRIQKWKPPPFVLPACIPTPLRALVPAYVPVWLRSCNHFHLISITRVVIIFVALLSYFTIPLLFFFFCCYCLLILYACCFHRQWLRPRRYFVLYLWQHSCCLGCMPLPMSTGFGFSLLQGWHTSLFIFLMALMKNGSPKIKRTG